MLITYVLLSPTFGMHQYTADLANRRLPVDGPNPDGPGLQAATRVVTTANAPRDRYAAGVELVTPLTTHGTGFSREGLDITAYRRVLAAIARPQPATPDRRILHFTGVHAWNVPLVYALRRRGLPVVHTLHDLDPHRGVRFAGAIRLWNRLIIRSGAHIIVHGRCYRDRLIAAGLAPDRVTFVPLLHGFWGHEAEVGLAALEAQEDPAHTRAQPPVALFFGRIEEYKGIDTLLAAWEQLEQRRGAAGSSDTAEARLVIAGRVAPGVALPALPRGVELRDRRIADAEGIELFRQASVLVLPYRDGTQSALPAVAYRFGLPVIVATSGALAEYVAPGKTGWVVPPGDTPALASALAEALAAPNHLHEMGIAGRLWYHQMRAQEKAALDRLYQQLIGH